MTTTVDERKHSRSVPWENYLYPKLRDPAYALDYLESAVKDEEHAVIPLSICDVIKANKDLPFIAYQVICAYSPHLIDEDIPPLVKTLQGLDKAHQEYLADLYWWLDMLKDTLNRGIHWIQVDAKPLDVPDELKASEAYQQWAKVA